jgi:hypothetical protein
MAESWHPSENNGLRLSELTTEDQKVPQAGELFADDFIKENVLERQGDSLW